MLENLSIRNIVLVEELDIDFDVGLCVLTGETGAGKSILLDALGLALGSRADLSLIRANTKKGSVTATFNISTNSKVKKILENNDIEVSELLNLRRTLSIDGKSKAFCNDISVSVGFLKKIGDNIAEVQSQRSENDLYSPTTQMQLLDRFAKNDEIKNKLLKVFSEKSELSNNIQNLEQRISELDLDQTFKVSAIKEIKDFKTFEGEEEKLVQERSIKKNLDKIQSILSDAFYLLSGPDGINASINKLDRTLSRSFDQFKGILDENFLVQIEKFLIEGNEIEYVIKNLMETITSEGNNIDEIEDRLFSLRALARKYNCSCDELPGIEKKLSQQITNKDELEESLSKIKMKLEDYEKKYNDLSEDLSRKRKQAAKQLEGSIANEFNPLRLENTNFKIMIRDKAYSDWNADGKDQIIFEVSTNKGVPFLPLSQVASGGEMSRIMLALHVILKRNDISKVIIFDEIDAGIGGPTADAVGERLFKLSKGFQIIAITHSPQVAAKGSFHLKIEKKLIENLTFTNVKQIEKSERQEEIARMLSGKNITVEARAAAANLLNGRINDYN
ncbi:MAG: DNA repair protein RecN [Rhodospirillaceae bacterium]|nr:DNA repair protein RecN [Rhodospirillaceae bacterium]